MVVTTSATILNPKPRDAEVMALLLTAERLVRCGRHNVRILKGRNMHASSDEAGDVRPAGGEIFSQLMEEFFCKWIRERLQR